MKSSKDVKERKKSMKTDLELEKAFLYAARTMLIAEITLQDEVTKLFNLSKSVTKENLEAFNLQIKKTELQLNTKIETENKLKEILHEIATRE